MVYSGDSCMLQIKWLVHVPFNIDVYVSEKTLCYISAVFNSTVIPTIHVRCILPHVTALYEIAVGLNILETLIKGGVDIIISGCPSIVCVE